MYGEEWAVIMAFEGWLLKVNGIVFPNGLIARDSYKITPDQIMDLDPYRDANGLLHRNVLPHTATSIEFSTPPLRSNDVDRVNRFITKENRERCEVEYWNTNTSVYTVGTFYIADVPYEIMGVDEKTGSALYKSIKLIFTEF